MNWKVYEKMAELERLYGYLITTPDLEIRRLIFEEMQRKGYELHMLLQEL